MKHSIFEIPDSTRQLIMLKNNIISLTFSPTGFSLGTSCPTHSPKANKTRVFIFLRSFRDLYAWLSLVLKLLVNERTTLTRGFYVQELNCLTVFSEQPPIQIIKEPVSIYYTMFVEKLLCNQRIVVDA